MYAKSKIFIFLLTILLSLSAAAFADTIRLKDGTTIKGKVIGFKDQQFTVLIGDGARQRRSQLTVYIEDVESIEFDDSANPAVNKIITGSQPRPDESSTATNNRDDEQPRTTRNPNVTVTQNPPPTTRPQNNSGGLSQVINSQPPSSSNNDSGNSSRGRFIVVKSANDPLKVTADSTSNGWTNAGYVVKKGQRVRISAVGRISLGSGRFATPAGVGSIADNERLMKTEPTGALIAVIGDDNNDFIFIGSSREFTAPRDGTLFLGVNEGNLDDNSGAFDVVIEAESLDNTTSRR